IQKFGFITPIVVDETGELLCGHARVLAARQLKIQAIPAVRASHLSESQKRAFVLADNRLAELASWNARSLKRELQFLSELDIDYYFLALGCENGEIHFFPRGCGWGRGPRHRLPPTARRPDLFQAGSSWAAGTTPPLLRLGAGERILSEAVGA